MNVLMLSPGFPVEMSYFTQALAKIGARVIGVGEQPVAAFSEDTRKALSAYVQVKSLVDEKGVIDEIRREVLGRGLTLDRIECLWEPFIILAAQLREAFGVPGMDVATALPFRDKEAMKQKLDAAGIRTPRHAKCSNETESRAAAERIGYPLIIKPIAGAGSADTHRCDDPKQFEAALAATRHVPVVSVEEFIDGEEFTFDTITVDNVPRFYNVCWYRPRPLIQRQHEWISPQTIALRDPDAPRLRSGVKMGFDVIRALEYPYGFTHMEWFLKQDGEAVFGEIGGRVPGARTSDLMNFATDSDVYIGWAQAVCFGRVDQPFPRKFNAASIFKRAQGQGHIQRITGVEGFLARYGQYVAVMELLPVGAPRRNWKQTLISDGIVIVRHQDLGSCCEIADHVGTDIQLYAG